MIDILMATYNGEVFLEEQLDSIIHQSYSEWHLIVRDDCSSDQTVSILQKYKAMYPEKISVIINENRTGSAKANFFKLLHDAQSNYIMFSDQDDIWRADKLKLTLKRMKHLEKESKEGVPLLVATDLEVVDAEGEKIDTSFLRYMNLPRDIRLNHLLIQNNITGCTVMMNRTLCEMLKEVKSVEKIVMHDHFAGLTAVTFGRAVMFDRATIQYRQHAKNSVGAMDAKSFAYMYQRFKRGRKQFRLDMMDSMKQAEYLVSLYAKNFDADMAWKRQMILQYSQLVRRSRVEKYRFYVKYHVFKHGLVRQIMQVIWC